MQAEGEPGNAKRNVPDTTPAHALLCIADIPIVSIDTLVKRISKAEREEGIIDNIDRRWKDRDHALFVGYAPYDKPKYAISVIVEHGGSGSSMAAPIARDILQFALERHLV